MDRIRDKASRYFKDAYKKKITIGNKTSHGDVISGHNKREAHPAITLSNGCCYCQKEFVSPKFLLKHIHRRHPEDLILLHKKFLMFLNTESDCNSNSSKSLFSFLEGEFTLLKNELNSMKRVINKINRNEDFSDLCKENDDSDIIEKHTKHCLHSAESGDSAEKMNDAANESFSSEVTDLKIKVQGMEGTVQCLCGKLEELFKTLNSEISSRQDFCNQVTSNENENLKKQERILVELRSNLLQDFQIMLSNKLQENKGEFDFQISDLRHEIERLNCLVDSNTKQINSPDHLAVLEKKLEKQIIYFLGQSNRSKGKMSQSKHSKPHHLPMTKQRSKIKGKLLELNDSKNYNAAVDFSKNKESLNYSSYNEPCVTSKELSFMVAEKMADFNIDPNATKMSCAEYHEKIKLLNLYKEELCGKYQDFAKMYNEINMYADQLVISRLKNKKSRKLRFSEPLTLDKNVFQDQIPSKNFHNKTYPIEGNGSHNFVFPQQNNNDQNFADLGGGGDCSWNFLQVKCHSKEQLESSSLEEVKNARSACGNSDSRPINPDFSNNNRFPNLRKPIGTHKILDCPSTEVSANSKCGHMNSVAGTEKMPSSKFKENISQPVNEQIDDLDEISSLESLASWEDQENPIT